MRLRKDVRKEVKEDNFVVNSKSRGKKILGGPRDPAYQVETKRIA